jgi:hypothetical protein
VKVCSRGTGEKIDTWRVHTLLFAGENGADGKTARTGGFNRFAEVAHSTYLRISHSDLNLINRSWEASS